MGSMTAFLSAFNLMTWSLNGVQGQTRQKSSQKPTTQLLQNAISTSQNDLPQNSGSLHGGVIAFILLGCIIFLILVGICIVVGYLRKRKSEEYTLRWEKNFEVSSFEMLDREVNKSPTERRVTKKKRANDMNLISKCEEETVI